MSASDINQDMYDSMLANLEAYGEATKGVGQTFFDGTHFGGMAAACYVMGYALDEIDEGCEEPDLMRKYADLFILAIKESFMSTIGDH